MQQSRKTTGSGRTGAIAAATLIAGGLALANRARAKAAVREHPPQGQFIDVDGVCLHYVEKGSGPPILLVHGNGVMMQDWIISGLFDELARTHRVIAVDRPGFGYSSRPRGTRWTPERQADLLAALLPRIDVKRPILVGHSFGATVAAAMAVRHPDLVKGVALLGGYFYPTPRADVVLISGSAIPGYGDLLNRTLMPLLGEALQERVNHKIFDPAPIPSRWRREFSFALALRPSRMRAGAADAVHMVPAAARLAPEYPQARLPVTILAGRGDRMVDAGRHSERLHHDLPHSRLTLFDGVGHMVHHSRMRETAAAIRGL